MIHDLFHPKSVAVIGASTKDLSIGNVIIKNLLHYDFQGEIYPINPKAPEVRGLKAYPSILDCPTDVDLAHISIPSKFVPLAIEQCGQKGVKNIVINSAGFKEIGAEGEALQKLAVETAQKNNIRIFGPNCQGIINTHSDYKAYCDFTFTYPKSGNISIVAQSGGVGAVLMQRFFDLDIGLRFYASNGNACDVSIPEIIEYYGEDEDTKVIVLYVESFSDPSEFIEVAKKVSKKKPILAMRSGKTEEGAKAALSHTGGLVDSGLAIDLVFDKLGILAFSDEEEMCQSAIAFAMQKVPDGNRVGIITDTGGPAIIATDTLVNGGLTMPDLSEKAVSELSGKLFPEASIANPIDVLATANASHYRAAMDVLLEEDQIDSIFINFVTPPFVDCEAVAREMVEVSNLGIKPVICNLMTDRSQWGETIKILNEGGIPCYDFPEGAAKALSSLVKYSNILKQEDTEIVNFDDVDRKLVGQIIGDAKENKKEILEAKDVYKILEAYKIPVASWGIAENEDDLLAKANEIGYPLVLKADSEKAVHKSDQGGVKLNIKTSEELKKSASEISENIKADDLKYFLQKFSPEGHEIIIGAKSSPGIGHVIMFGLGGIFVELLKDVSFGLTPVSKSEAKNMTESIKSAEILKGYRGEKSGDVEGLINIILRVSQLVSENPEIEELDLNPIKAREDACLCVDARMKIGIAGI
jgi:acetate---CoA ligase (ADP-forming)